MDYVPAPCRDDVECVLKRLLESRVRFTQQLAAPVSPEIPTLELSGEVDLGVYDRLLGDD